MKNGNIALLNNINLDFLGIKFRSLISTPILWLAFLQIEIICSEKFRLESNTTPRSMILSLVFDIIHANITVILIEAQVQNLVLFKITRQ